MFDTFGPNTLDRASWLSILFIHFVQPLLNRGNRQPLTFSDIDEVPVRNKSSVFEETLLKPYDQGKPIISTIFAAYKLRIFLCLIASILYVACTQVMPICVNYILDFLRGNTDNFLVQHAIGISIGLFALQVVNVLCVNNSFYHTTIIASDLRAAAMLAVYKKSLRLSPSARNSATVGEIVTLMSVDCERIWNAIVISMWFFSSPISLIATIIILYSKVGWPSLLALAVFVFATLANGIIAGMIADKRKVMLSNTAERVKLQSELLQGIRVVKLYAWEQPLMQRVSKLRGSEVSALKWFLMLMGGNSIFQLLTPVFMASVIFIGVVYGQGKSLNTAEAYTILAYINLLRMPSIMLPNCMRSTSDMLVSLKRLRLFLNLPEISRNNILLNVDSNPIIFDSTSSSSKSTVPIALEMKKATISWLIPNENIIPVSSANQKPQTRKKNHIDTTSNTESADNQQNKRSFASPAALPIISEMTLSIPKGSLCLVVGSTGSGKSSLLSSVLGQINVIGGYIIVNGRCSYAAQEPWIRNLSVRDNIIFNESFDEKRYHDVVSAAQLLHDFTQLPHGDLTEVGERGLTLSGGQKARVAFARALYKSNESDIMILDDPLSAVDMKVARAMFTEAIQSYLQSKTVILTLNSHYHLLSEADYIIVLGESRILTQGTYKQVKQSPYFENFTAAEAAWNNAESISRAGSAVSIDPANRMFPRVTVSPLLAPNQPPSPLLVSPEMDGQIIMPDLDNTEAMASIMETAADAGLEIRFPHLKEAPGLDHRSTIERMISRAESNIECEGPLRLLRAHTSSPEIDGETTEIGQCGHSISADPTHFDHRKELHKIEEVVLKRKSTGLSDSFDEDMHVKFKPEDSIIDAVRGTQPNTPLEEDPVTHIKEKKKSALTNQEDKATGTISFNVYLKYFGSSLSGGVRSGMAMFSIIILVFSIMTGCRWGTDFIVGRWTEDSEKHRSDQWWVAFYLIAVAVVVVCSCVKELLVVFVSANSARTLHDRSFSKVLRASVPNFFDVTPLGRIINRFSKDLDQIDLLLPDVYNQFQTNSLLAAILLGTCIASAPWFAIALIPLGAAFWWTQHFFRKSSREMKRLEALSRSPIFVSFEETLNGLASIRAFDVVGMFIRDMQSLIDNNIRIFLANWMIARWIALHLDLVACFATLCSAILLVCLKKSVDPAMAGLALTYVIQLSGMLQWTVRVYIDTENNMTAVERVDEYSQLPSEAPEHCGLKPLPPNLDDNTIYPDEDEGITHCLNFHETVEPTVTESTTSWPTSGHVKFENVWMKYRPGLKYALKGMSFEALPGQKIGVCGRSGAGKSTVLQSLFRLVEPQRGRIFIDGVDTRTIGLRTLRSQLSVIPQDPVLLSGTLRENLDPFERYSSSQLWEALEIANLANDIKKMFIYGGATVKAQALLFAQQWAKNRGNDYEGNWREPAESDIMLLQPVAERGENFSIGQRQLICVARALLKKTKIILLDEATANVDKETDQLIQEGIRKGFENSTVITVAHRLDTIVNCDKILVVADGRVGEFDTPENLLNNPESHFRKLVAEMGEEMVSIILDGVHRFKASATQESASNY